MALLCKLQEDYILFCSMLYQEWLTIVENHITNRNAANGNRFSNIPALIFIRSCHVGGDCIFGN